MFVRMMRIGLVNSLLHVSRVDLGSTHSVTSLGRTNDRIWGVKMNCIENWEKDS